MLNRYALIIISIVCFYACREENMPCMDPTNPDCPNFDSCLVFEPAQAAFSMFDSIAGITCYAQLFEGIVYETDTFIGQRVLFKANQIADYYSWTIGTDTVEYHAKSFTYEFNPVQELTDVAIKLVVCKSPPALCQVKECDTIYKGVHIIPSPLNISDWSNVIGRFKGAASFQDSVIITIPLVSQASQGIINFPEECEDSVLSVSIYRNHFIIHPADTACFYVCGLGYMQEDRDHLVIDYITRQDFPEFILYTTKKWQGRRIE